MKKAYFTFSILLVVSILCGCVSPEIQAPTTTEIPSSFIEETTRVIETSTESQSSDSLPTETAASSATEYIDYSYEEAYKETINNWLASYEYDTSSITYNLIYFDEDNTPELVWGVDGYWVSMFTYKNNRVYTLIDNWAYGAMGNIGYYFIPHKNMLYNSNADYAGALYTECILSIDKNTELSIIWVGTHQSFEPGNDPLASDFVYLDEPLYFIDDEELSEEEYYQSMPYPLDETDFCISGMYSYDEIMLFLTSEFVPQIEKYQLNIMDITWEDANEYCNSHGGHLATISSDLELLQICRTVEYYYRDYCIFFVGGMYCSNTSDYRWVTDDSNETIDSNLWRTGEPTYTGATEDGRTVDENYTCFLKIDGNYYLMDVPSDIIDAAPSYSGKVGFICEFD